MEDVPIAFRNVNLVKSVPILGETNEWGGPVNNEWGGPLDKCNDDDGVCNSSQHKAGISRKENETVTAIRNTILSKRTTVHPGEVEETLIGMDNIKKAIIEAIVVPQRIKILPTFLLQGILLAGPPGVAKTTLLLNSAKFAATSLGMPISVFQVSYGDALSAYVGESEKFIQILFEVAQDFNPSVILLDEVDGFMKKRSATESEHSTRHKATLLSHMQGFKNSYGVVLLATTNKPHLMDSGFVRRFPERFLIKLPNPIDRENLFRNFLEQAQTHCHVDMGSLDLSKLAAKSNRFSGDDIRNVVAKALRRKYDLNSKSGFGTKPTITMIDIEAALADTKISFDNEELKKLYLWGRTMLSSRAKQTDNVESSNRNRKTLRKINNFLSWCCCCFFCHNC